MSYRLRLGSFPKKQAYKYIKKSYEEIIEEFGKEDYFNFGSPEEFEEIEYIEGFNYKNSDKWKPFYSFYINEKDYDFKFHILKEEDLKEIINYLSKEVSKYYKELYEQFEEEDTKGRIASLIMSRKNDWNNDFFNILNFNKDDLVISNSGYYEYCIFNLISIYKNFNWNDKYLILSGW